MIWQDATARLAVRLLDKKHCEKYAVDAIFSGLDLDTANYGLLMLLSLVGYRCGWLYFPKDAVSRLSGLNRFNRVRNHLTLKAALETCDMLNHAGIPHMLTGSLAASFYCNSIMLDRIPEARIAVGCMPSATIPDNVICQARPFSRCCDAVSTMSRSSIAGKIDGYEVTIPCPEDVLLDILTDECSRIISGRAEYDSLQWMADLFELSGVVDWERLRQRAVGFGVMTQVSVMMNLAEALAPGLMPSGVFDFDWDKTGWFDRKFNPERRTIWNRLFYYVPDRKSEWDAMRRLCLTEVPFIFYLASSVLSHFRRDDCCYSADK